METIITHPFFATFFGWLAFNILLFSIDKDTFDDQKRVFPIKEYIGYTWDNWLRSLLMIPVILFVGAKALNLNPLADGNSDLACNDAYYVGVGFITELVIVTWKKWKAKNG